MAKTREKPNSGASQAAPGVWSPDDLSAALERGSVEDKIALLKTVGILTADGTLAPKYQNWGREASRTPEVGDDSGAD